MFRRSKKAQSTAEYAIVIGLVIAAVVGMQVYVKRGIQAKVKDASDADVSLANIPNGKDDSGQMYGVNAVASGQYEPEYATTNAMVTERNSTEKASVFIGGGVKREIIGNEVTNRSGNTDILFNGQ